MIATGLVGKLGRLGRGDNGGWAAPGCAEQAAFGKSWEALRPQVWRLTARISGSADAADDLTQEVGLRALEALPKFRGTTDLRTYLYRIAVNVALRHNEQRRQRREVTGAEADDSLAAIGRGPAADVARSPERQALLADRLPRIRAALDDLPPDLRTPLILVVHEDMKYREIAAVLEIPIGTVMSRIHAARQRLRAALPEEFGNETL